MANGQKYPKKQILSLQLDLNKFNKASDAEKQQQERMRESTTFFKDGIRRMHKNKIAMVSFYVIILIAIIAFIVPLFYPYDYSTTGANNKLTANFLDPMQYSPQEQAAIASGQQIFPHILGTDDLGRDYAARVIYGTRISLLVGILAATIVVIIGVIYGAISGYFGGRTDLIMMRIVDIIYALPDMLIIILLSVAIKDIIIKGDLANTWVSKVGAGMVSIFIVFGLLYWVGMARLVRGQILSIKEEEFVLSAKAMGAKASHIIRKHMIPNCISVIFVSATLQIPAAIFTESYLSFLGLGVNIPMPSLGSLAADAQDMMWSHPIMMLFPALMIFLIVLSINLFGNGLRDAFDPTLQEAK